MQITGGLQMLGDQRGVFISRFRLVVFDRRGQPAAQLGTI
jgi:hypothetical protein